MSIYDRTLIIDTTYECNSNCIYCQWASGNNVNRVEPSLNHLLVSPKDLEILKIERVVFSGGEPLLSENIERLVTYYSGHKLETIIISNGLLMSNQKASKLIKLGLGGVTFSLDTLNSQVYGILRGLNKFGLSKILHNIKDIRLNNPSLEIGINTTLTHYNIKTPNIKSLLDFVIENELDFIKFQPAFDDGYLGNNAPEAILSSKDLNSIKENEIMVDRYINNGLTTNPASFWHDLYLFIEGKVQIDPTSCSAISHQLILFNDGLRSCYWRPDFRFNRIDGSLEYLISRYRRNLNRCNVNYWCFCNQPINHKWRWLK